MVWREFWRGFGEFWGLWYVDNDDSGGLDIIKPHLFILDPDVLFSYLMALSQYAIHHVGTVPIDKVSRIVDNCVTYVVDHQDFNKEYGKDFYAVGFFN